MMIRIQLFGILLLLPKVVLVVASFGLLRSNNNNNNDPTTTRTQLRQQVPPRDGDAIRMSSVLFVAADDDHSPPILDTNDDDPIKIRIPYTAADDEMRMTRRQTLSSSLRWLVGATMISTATTPTMAFAAPAECYQDCFSNCKAIAPKNLEYCKETCQDYCSQTDRTGT